MANTMCRLGCGAAGGIVAGATLTGLFLLIERASGKPSDIVQLGRRTATALGSPYLHQDSLPSTGEQLRYHGGHLLLSAGLGAVYPMVNHLPGVRGAPGGLLLGAACYPLFWGLLGPRLGLTPTPRQEGLATVARRLAIHAGFGLLAALVANLLARPAVQPAVQPAAQVRA
jgi:hypothetical protein